MIMNIPIPLRYYEEIIKIPNSYRIADLPPDFIENPPDNEIFDGNLSSLTGGQLENDEYAQHQQHAYGNNAAMQCSDNISVKAVCVKTDGYANRRGVNVMRGVNGMRGARGSSRGRNVSGVAGAKGYPRQGHMTRGRHRPYDRPRAGFSQQTANFELKRDFRKNPVGAVPLYVAPIQSSRSENHLSTSKLILQINLNIISFFKLCFCIRVNVMNLFQLLFLVIGYMALLYLFNCNKIGRKKGKTIILPMRLI